VSLVPDGEDPFEPVFGAGRGLPADILGGHLSGLSAERDLEGRVIRATALGAGGRLLALDVGRGLHEEREAECAIHVSAPDIESIHAAARVSAEEERVAFQFVSGEASVSWAADFSRYDETHLGVITGTVNGFALEGVFDPRRPTSTFQIALEDWIDSATLARLRYFEPVFREMAIRGREESAGYEDVIQRTIHNSTWGTIGRRRAGV
jgi:hypothetical protein